MWCQLRFEDSWMTIVILLQLKTGETGGRIKIEKKKVDYDLNYMADQLGFWLRRAGRLEEQRSDLTQAPLAKAVLGCTHSRAQLPLLQVRLPLGISSSLLS